MIEAGDAIPADGRLIESATLTVEESSLTGESIPVKKIIDTLNLTETKVALGDRSNMVYTGSSIVYGRGKAIVTATGMIIYGYGRSFILLSVFLIFCLPGLG